MSSRTATPHALLALVALLCVSLTLAGCASPTTQKQNTILQSVPHTAGEALYEPVFNGTVNSTTISVLGIRLGTTEGDVLTKLGPADRAQEYDFGGIKNWEYGEHLGLSSTGVIYHIENGFVTRITLKPAMNAVLPEGNAVNLNKEEIYARYGIPNRQYLIKTGRFFVFNTMGLEEYIGNGETEYARAIVFPNRKLPSTATLSNLAPEQKQLTMPQVPRLMIDTTTLCSQGPTFGYNDATKKCTPYSDACSIPDNEIEVKSCGANDTTQEALIGRYW